MRPGSCAAIFLQHVVRWVANHNVKATIIYYFGKHNLPVSWVELLFVNSLKSQEVTDVGGNEAVTALDIAVQMGSTRSRSKDSQLIADTFQTLTLEDLQH